MNEAINYDVSGNITSISRESGVLSLGYDKVNQVTSSQFSSPSTLDTFLSRQWRYDATGNRVFDSLRGEGTFMANSILSDRRADYVSDADGFGNVAQRRSKDSDQVEMFDYRVDSKISSFLRLRPDSEGGQPKDAANHTILSASYAFDALGRRVAKTLVPKVGPAFTQSYLHFGDEDKILLGKSGNGTNTLYVDGESIDEHFGEVNSMKVAAYATDHLGSVVNGIVAGATKMFAVFGESASQALDISSSTSPVLYGYTGRQYDPEMRKNYYRAREFDQDSGRFMSLDPIRFAGGDMNLYRYVGNSTLRHTDPSGKVSLGSIAACLAFFAIGEGIDVLLTFRQQLAEIEAAQLKIDAITAKMAKCPGENSKLTLELERERINKEAHKKSAANILDALLSGPGGAAALVLCLGALAWL